MLRMEFLVSKTLISYPDAIDFMEKRASDIADGVGDELIWLLEHEAILTAGTSAKDEDVILNNLPIYKTNRGGKHTLHAPNQRVCYLLLNLKKRAGGVPDPKKYVKTLEEAIISSLARIGIKGEIREGRVGVWVVNNSGKEEKICAIGVRFKRGVTMHGFAINVSNDLSLFNTIIPCGIKEYGVCSIESLGFKVSFEAFDAILKDELLKRFSNK